MTPSPWNGEGNHAVPKQASEINNAAPFLEAAFSNASEDAKLRPSSRGPRPPVALYLKPSPGASQLSRTFFLATRLQSRLDSAPRPQQQNPDGSELGITELLAVRLCRGLDG